MFCISAVPCGVIRVIRFGLPEPEKLNIPPEVLASARLMKGLVLVTGSAGSGKSTTLACLINAINQTREGTSSQWKTPLNTSIGMTDVS